MSESLEQQLKGLVDALNVGGDPRTIAAFATALESYRESYRQGRAVSLELLRDVDDALQRMGGAEAEKVLRKTLTPLRLAAVRREVTQEEDYLGRLRMPMTLEEHYELMDAPGAGPSEIRQERESESEGVAQKLNLLRREEEMLLRRLPVEEAERALAELYEGSKEHEKDKARQREREAEQRLEAVRGWRQLGEERAAEFLIGALHDENRSVRAAAADALADLGDPRAVDALIAALEEKDQWVQMGAARALGELGDARAVEPLIAALQEEDDLVRREVTEATVKLGDARAVGPLIALLEDSGWIAERAAVALGEFGDARAIEPLIGIVRDHSRSHALRREAVKALRGMNDARAVEALVAAIQDRNEDLRKEAAAALGVLGDARAVGPLIAMARDEETKIRSLRDRGGRDVSVLREAINMRNLALGVLRSIDDPEAKAALIEFESREAEREGDRASQGRRRLP